jgi:hypothetical protein
VARRCSGPAQSTPVATNPRHREGLPRCCGPSRQKGLSDPRPPWPAAASSSGAATDISTPWTGRPGSRAGDSQPESRSTGHRRWRADSSSSPAPEVSTQSTWRAGKSAGSSPSGRTYPSGGDGITSRLHRWWRTVRSSWAPATATYTPSTQRPAPSAGASRPGGAFARHLPSRATWFTPAVWTAACTPSMLRPAS